MVEKSPLVSHTRAGRLVSMVRRMQQEQELDLPISERTDFAVSVKTGKPANAMTQPEWEKFYTDLRGQLQTNYPDLYSRLFPKKA